MLEASSDLSIELSVHNPFLAVLLTVCVLISAYFPARDAVQSQLGDEWAKHFQGVATILLIAAVIWAWSKSYPTDASYQNWEKLTITKEP